MIKEMVHFQIIAALSNFIVLQMHQKDSKVFTKNETQHENDDGYAITF